MAKSYHTLWMEASARLMRSWVEKASLKDLEQLAEHVDDNGNINWISALRVIRGRIVDIG